MANQTAAPYQRGQPYPAQQRGFVPVPFPQQEQYPPAYQNTPYTEQVFEDPVIVEAKRTHARGAWAYFAAWIILATGIVFIGFTLGLVMEQVISGGVDMNMLMDLFLATMGLLGSGIALRGVGFSLMMRADFVVRARAWTGNK
jgi:hypothetical protein